MSAANPRPGRTRHLAAESGKFVLNGKYVRTQAREAVATFVAPLAGVVWAIMGKSAADQIADGGKRRAGTKKYAAAMHRPHKAPKRKT